MIVEPQAFLELAKILAAGTNPPPERLRTATGRAYYAAYNVIVQELGIMGIGISQSASGHGEVTNFLGNSRDRELQTISSSLSTLRTNRNHADYRLDFEQAESPNNVRGHVEQATRIITTVRRCCSGPNRTSIIQAMKEFDAINRGRRRPPN